MACESVTAKQITPLYKTASVKSTIQLYVQKGVTLHVSESKTDGDCKFGKTPGGWALLEGKFPEVNFSTKKCAKKGKVAEKKEKVAEKKSAKKGKIAEKGMIQGKWVFGPFTEATEENKEVTRGPFEFETGIPERAFGALSVKVTYDDNDVYSGGFNRKNREHVFVLTPRVLDNNTCEIKAFKRLYPHEVAKEADGFAWTTPLTIAYTIRIPTEEVESEDESDGGNALLGGDDSDSESSS